MYEWIVHFSMLTSLIYNIYILIFGIWFWSNKSISDKIYDYCIKSESMHLISGMLGLQQLSIIQSGRKWRCAEWGHIRNHHEYESCEFFPIRKLIHFISILSISIVNSKIGMKRGVMSLQHIFKSFYEFFFCCCCLNWVLISLVKCDCTL